MKKTDKNALANVPEGSIKWPEGISPLEEIVETDPRYWEVTIWWKDPVRGNPISRGMHVDYEYAQTALQAINVCADGCAPDPKWTWVTSQLVDPSDK